MDVQALPEGLLVDPYDDVVRVSSTPFLMAGVRPAGVPIVPSFTFPETNLRTYVRRHNGRDGLWFLTIRLRAP